MDATQIAIVAWGLGVGLCIIPVYEGVARWVFRTWNPGSDFFGSVVMALIAAVAACCVAAVLILGPGYLFGLIPLRENTPYFGLPFLAGGLAMRLFIEWRARQKKEFR